jgi:signal peptidase I
MEDPHNLLNQPDPAATQHATQPVAVPPVATPDRKPSGAASELFEFVWETAKVVLLSLVIILPVRYYLIQPFFVKGSSMVPNFHDKEYILVDKWTYRLGAPERGDVIIFRYPDNPKEYFIKRILGLPGETVVAGNDNEVVVYNSRYPEGFTVFERQYLPETNPTYCGTNTTYCGTRVTLGEDEYYVMGDNREHSSDSRFFGPVHISYFAGMAWLRLWPLDKISFIPRTDYPPIVQ